MERTRLHIHKRAPTIAGIPDSWQRECPEGQKLGKNGGQAPIGAIPLLISKKREIYSLAPAAKIGTGGPELSSTPDGNNSGSPGDS